MKFATFFTNSTGYVPDSSPPKFSPEFVKPIEVCGSDGVAIFDGRFGINRIASEARAICVKRGFIGFQIESGESFTRSRIIRKYERI